MGKMTDLLDEVLGEFARAIQDGRQKVVEEGWFGRAVTGDPVIQQESGRDIWGRDQSFEEKWAPREPALEPARDTPEPGHDIDR